MARKSEPACPVEVVLQVLGGRWKSLVVYHLFAGTRRYSDLQRAIPNASPKMLTQQLRELERDGLVSRTTYAEVPPRVEYSMTPLGMTLRGMMREMCAWGTEYQKIRPKGKVLRMPARESA